GIRYCPLIVSMVCLLGGDLSRRRATGNIARFPADSGRQAGTPPSPWTPAVHHLDTFPRGSRPSAYSVESQNTSAADTVFVADNDGICIPSACSKLSTIRG